MSVWDKKFEQLLADSKENTTLKERVSSLEDQVAKMQHALGHLMKSYVDLAKMTMDHRKGLEEVFEYLTAEELEGEALIAEDDEATPEEAAERKRMMN